MTLIRQEGQVHRQIFQKWRTSAAAAAVVRHSYDILTAYVACPRHFRVKAPFPPRPLPGDTRILGDVIPELPLPISGYRFLRLISV